MKFTATALATVTLLGLFSPAIAESKQAPKDKEPCPESQTEVAPKPAPTPCESTEVAPKPVSTPCEATEVAPKPVSTPCETSDVAGEIHTTTEAKDYDNSIYSSGFKLELSVLSGLAILLAL